MAEREKRGFFEEIEFLKREKRKIADEIRILKRRYSVLLEEYQPLIDDLQEQADQLASRFRTLYRESQEAYLSGDGALAKALSIEGHYLQNECEALNEQANAMRKELRAILDEIENKSQRLEEIRARIRGMPRPSIRGFEKSGIFDNQDVQRFLNNFPAKIFQVIDSVRYEHVFYRDRNDARVGSLHWNFRTGKAVIDIYWHPSEEISLEDDTKRGDLKRTIAHEIGHIVFEKFMADTERWQWGEWYMESRQKGAFISPEAEPGRGDDFSECFAVFMINPRKLEKFDLRRYNFIKEIYFRLEEENYEEIKTCGN